MMACFTIYLDIFKIRWTVKSEAEPNISAMVHALHTKWVLSAMVQYASEYELLRHGLTAGSDHQHPIVLLHRRMRVILLENIFYR
jgi:hypothetical protein